MNYKMIIRNIIRARSKTVIERISSYIKQSTKTIDIGSGTGDVAFLLKKRGNRVTPVDVDDFHGPQLVQTIIYDGKTLPFPNHSFDTALLLMVMHHTPNPDVVFTEAARVIIETSFTNPINKFFTVFSDAIGNLRINTFWNSYKSDKAWGIFFEKHGFQVKESRKFNDKNLGVIPFLHILYYLQRS